MPREKQSKPPWQADRPPALGPAKPLPPKAKARARSAAAKAGRPYPNLVDNMRAARSPK